MAAGRVVGGSEGKQKRRKRIEKRLNE